MPPSLPANAEHPWPSGHIFQSPGAHLTYRVVGPCCRLYDREQLPWPCCRLQWRGKEPSWRRIGRRFIVDLSTQRHPSYCVEIVGHGYRGEAFVTTLYTTQLSPAMQDWWHTRRRPQSQPPQPECPQSVEVNPTDLTPEETTVSAATQDKVFEASVSVVVECPKDQLASTVPVDAVPINASEISSPEPHSLPEPLSYPQLSLL